jgi:hypothetical protein
MNVSAAPLLLSHFLIYSLSPTLSLPLSPTFSLSHSLSLASLDSGLILKSQSRIHNTSFSSYYKNGSNKLERYITLGCKACQGQTLWLIGPIGKLRSVVNTAPVGISSMQLIFLSKLQNFVKLFPA